MILFHLFCANADTSPAEPVPLFLHKIVCCVFLLIPSNLLVRELMRMHKIAWVKDEWEYVTYAEMWLTSQSRVCDMEEA